jgi:two-component system KDP operon response regulator KdpE
MHSSISSVFCILTPDFSEETYDHSNQQSPPSVRRAGADDYLTKPFAVGELMGRIRVARRHAEQAGRPEEPLFITGELRMDRARRQVFVSGAEVHLTPIEYQLLATLVRHAGKVVTQRQLLREVWGTAYEQEAQYLRTYMTYLRHKLEADPTHPRFLTTEIGVGYRLRAD